MRYEVIVQAMDNAGEVVWGYSKSEVVVPEDDAQASFVRLADATLNACDEARAAIIEQAATDAPHIAAEAEREREGKRRD